MQDRRQTWRHLWLDGAEARDAKVRIHLLWGDSAGPERVCRATCPQGRCHGGYITGRSVEKHGGRAKSEWGCVAPDIGKILQEYAGRAVNPSTVGANTNILVARMVSMVEGYHLPRYQ